MRTSRQHRDDGIEPKDGGMALARETQTDGAFFSLMGGCVAMFVAI